MGSGEVRTRSRKTNFAISILSFEGAYGDFLMFDTKKERDLEFKRLLKQGYFEDMASNSHRPIIMMRKCHFNSTVYYPDEQVTK